MNIIVCGAAAEPVLAACARLAAACHIGSPVITAGIDVSDTASRIELVAWNDTMPMMVGSVVRVEAVRRSHKERFWHVRPCGHQSGVAICTLTTRRAARRDRGKSKAVRRAAQARRLTVRQWAESHRVLR